MIWIKTWLNIVAYMSIMNMSQLIRGKALAPNEQQAFTWTYIDPVRYKRHQIDCIISLSTHVICRSAAMI